MDGSQHRIVERPCPTTCGRGHPALAEYDPGQRYCSACGRAGATRCRTGARHGPVISVKEKNPRRTLAMARSPARTAPPAPAWRLRRDKTRAMARTTGLSVAVRELKVGKVVNATVLRAVALASLAGVAAACASGSPSPRAGSTPTSSSSTAPGRSSVLTTSTTTPTSSEHGSPTAEASPDLARQRRPRHRPHADGGMDVTGPRRAVYGSRSSPGAGLRGNGEQHGVRAVRRHRRAGLV